MSRKDLIQGDLMVPRRVAGGLGAALLAAALWWRRNPTACPYGQRFWLKPPHPLITRERLHRVLLPVPGERLLEVGPGTGYYSLGVARALSARGQLDLFDLQQEMLDHTSREALEQGIENVAATQGDARALPFEDDLFDGAFLVAVLGEIPDRSRALGELARVVRPGGRVVVGELFGDPHWVRPSSLRDDAEGAGLSFEQRLGSALGYFARLGVPRG